MPLLSDVYKDERRPLRIMCWILGVLFYLVFNLWLNAEVRSAKHAALAEHWRLELMQARLEQVDTSHFQPPQTEPEGDASAYRSENPVADTDVPAGGYLSDGATHERTPGRIGAPGLAHVRGTIRVGPGDHD